jgi:hypothetical protein
LKNDSLETVMCIDQKIPQTPANAAANSAGNPATSNPAASNPAASNDATAPILRIEPVDNWHANWPNVVQAIRSHGQVDSLLVDRDGWLSARQVLLVAFADQAVAGHICFRIVPGADPTGAISVEARLDTFGVTPGFEKLEIGPTLKHAARQRAESLKCSKLVGF